jgi:hypothetical protein
MGMFRTVRRLPLFKVLAVVQVALLARRHLGALTPIERRRMAELARHGHHLTREERAELRRLASKLEPRAFAVHAADRLAPFPVPRWLTGRASGR